MKKRIALCMACLLIASGGCGAPIPEMWEPRLIASQPTESSHAVSLTVATSYGHGPEAALYRKATEAFEAATGHTIIDRSSVSSEEWKAKVHLDFMMGAEADVLFYFTGPDIIPILKKVVPINEIRAEYPDYADNMDPSFLPVSPNGKTYGIPVHGSWEALFVNRKVLRECGVNMPGPQYSWERFLDDCQTILDAGYIPIASSLEEVPHYWFELAVFNHGPLRTHATIPKSKNDPLCANWIAGLEDIKALYDRGFFPENTATMSNAEAWQLAYEDRAAFVADGSWEVPPILENANSPEDWAVTYFPDIGGERKATDVISGISMGYMITRKVWDNPEKREAAIDFVRHMTSREVISAFGQARMTALKGGVIEQTGLTPLEESGRSLVGGATGMSYFCGDMLTPDARNYLFDQIKRICSGELSAREVVDATLRIQYGSE